MTRPGPFAAVTVQEENSPISSWGQNQLVVRPMSFFAVVFFWRYAGCCLWALSPRHSIESRGERLLTTEDLSPLILRKDLDETPEVRSSTLVPSPGGFYPYAIAKIENSAWPPGGLGLEVSDRCSRHVWFSLHDAAATAFWLQYSFL
jgi:hypothetical protein